MALIDDLELPKETIQTEEHIRDALGRNAWAWFREHEHVVILEVRFLVFTRKVKLKELEFFFGLLFGPASYYAA